MTLMTEREAVNGHKTKGQWCVIALTRNHHRPSIINYTPTDRFTDLLSYKICNEVQFGLVGYRMLAPKYSCTYTQFQILSKSNFELWCRSFDMRSPGNARKPQVWRISLSQNSAKMRKINKPQPYSYQFWRFSRYINMQNFRPFPPCVLQQIAGNLSGRTDGGTDGRTCHKTVTVGRMDQRTHVQVKRGYFRLRTDGQTDGRTDERTDNRKHNASSA